MVLRAGLEFSDGAAITADDVVYSAKTAMGNQEYASRLANISQVSADAQGNVVFTLAQPDREFANLLTFPIIRSETAGWDLPAGRGRYLYDGEEG